MKEVKGFGLFVDGSVMQVKAGEFSEKIQERDEDYGTYKIKWLEEIVGGKVAVRYNAKYVGYIEYF